MRLNIEIWTWGYVFNDVLFSQMEDIQLTGCKSICTKVEGTFVVEGQSVYTELQSVRFSSHQPSCSPEELIRRRYHCPSELESVGSNFGHSNLNTHGHHHTGHFDWGVHHIESQQTQLVWSPSQSSQNSCDDLHCNSQYPTSFLTPPTTPSPPLDNEGTPTGLWHTDNGSRYEDITSDSGPESPEQTPLMRNLFSGSRASGKKGQKRRHSASGGHQRNANSKRRQRTCFSQEQVG